MYTQAKGITETGFYQFEWNAFLNGSAIQTAVWTLSTGITNGGTAISGTKTNIYVSGGSENQVYNVSCKITTADGRTEEQYFTLWVRDDSRVYGSPDGVAALVPRYANTSGYFDETTRPRMSQVASFLAELSGMVNVMLAGSGFALPMTLPEARLSFDVFVNGEAASFAEGVNGSGKFSPSSKSPVVNRYKIVLEDVKAFISDFAPGLEAMGATRTGSGVGEIGFREYDDNGALVTPLFTRDEFS